MILYTDAIIRLPSRSAVLLMPDQIRLYHRHWIVPRRRRKFEGTGDLIISACRIRLAAGLHNKWQIASTLLT
jgi:hypothetical protein